jgi:hypothetical protein
MTDCEVQRPFEQPILAGGTSGNAVDQQCTDQGSYLRSRHWRLASFKY